MNTYIVGDRVAWVSQAQGSRVRKIGQVVEVVEAGRMPSPRPGLDNCGSARKEKSYVINVPGKTLRAKLKPYWPVASLLRPAKDTEKLGLRRV